jgi:hypothetical protein
LNQLAETKSFLDSLLTSAEFEKLHMVNLDQKKKIHIYQDVIQELEVKKKRANRNNHRMQHYLIHV